MKEISVEHIDAHQNIELAQKFGVRTVPTLVVVDGEENTNYVGLAGVLNIKKILKRLRKIMNFAGMIKTSMVDYPKKVATTLFSCGCNLTAVTVITRI